MTKYYVWPLLFFIVGCVRSRKVTDVKPIPYTNPNCYAGDTADAPTAYLGKDGLITTGKDCEEAVMAWKHTNVYVRKDSSII